jgi:butyryl-CoA dehydrogenase
MRRTIDFLLNDWLDVASLAARFRYAEHSAETIAAVIDTCERVAAEQFAPFNRQVDIEEPRLENDGAVLPAGAHISAQAYVESGMLAASADYAMGGMQLPYVVEMAANAFFAKAGIALGGGNMLTTGNANLLIAHGTDCQKDVFARNELSGRWFGTMCLSEPQAGSSLSDITARAVPDCANRDVDPLGPRYRVFGNKMWITNGDHDLTENIVHLVLAKIPDAGGVLRPGTKGISLFIVPKKLVDEKGMLTGERNDVALAGLNHKLGYRGFPNTLLNFGEGRYPVRGAAGAIGYLVGEAGHGLRYMFHMMNEARINVGLGAAAIGYAGYEVSLEYAKNRKQGRRVTAWGKDAAAPPVRIIEHADVKRMLLAQKAYAEGGIALELYCARLVDEMRTGSPQSATDARLLLEILTPVAKSWPSEWCLEANSLAIQVHGGYGYTRDYPVEQYWRDNRLNMIHEGAHGIHGLDLLGRKVKMNDGDALHLFAHRVMETVMRADTVPALAIDSEVMAGALHRLRMGTTSAWETDSPEDALANATPYLQAFGHVTLAWIWLDVAATALRSLAGIPDGPRKDHLQGLVQAAKYFFAYELPKVDAWLGVVAQRNRTCRDMREEWF